MVALDGGLLEAARRYKRILVFGAGGGGDALGTVHLYLRLRELGAEPVIGAIAWERLPVDPHPGPIPLESLINAEPIGWSSAIVTGETRALRWGLEVHPQIARVAGALGVEALFIDASKGAEGVATALKDASEALGIELVIALDTGGDMLAKGCEDQLWSPLADAVSLAGLHQSGLPGLVAIHGPGADGELPPETVLEYASRLARTGALVEVTGLRRIEAEYIRRIMDKVYSEASKIPVHAFMGETGLREIRGGTRRVKVGLLQATTIILDSERVYEWSIPAQEVAGTRGIGQASQRLNKRCIVTELDLENELARLREKPRPEPMSLEEVRRRILQRILRSGCEPIECPGD